VSPVHHWGCLLFYVYVSVTITVTVSPQSSGGSCSSPAPPGPTPVPDKVCLLAALPSQTATTATVTIVGVVDPAVVADTVTVISHWVTVRGLPHARPARAHLPSRDVELGPKWSNEYLFTFRYHI